MNKYNLAFGSIVKYVPESKIYTAEEKKQIKNKMKSNNDTW